MRAVRLAPPGLAPPEEPYVHAVRAGDTLRIAWTVTNRQDKPKHDGGIVSLTGVCTNQDETKVAEAEAKMLVANNPRN